MLAVSGPDSYISPDWYGTGTNSDQVPTWNYVAVHAFRGTSSGAARMRRITPRPPGLAVGTGSRTSFDPKPPWMPSKVSPDQLGKLMRSIMPVELSVESVDGTWKLNQNSQGRERSSDFNLGRTACRERRLSGKRPLHVRPPDAEPARQLTYRASLLSISDGMSALTVTVPPVRRSSSTQGGGEDAVRVAGGGVDGLEAA